MREYLVTCLNSEKICICASQTKSASLENDMPATTTTAGILATNDRSDDVRARGDHRPSWVRKISMKDAQSGGGRLDSLTTLALMSPPPSSSRVFF